MRRKTGRVIASEAKQPRFKIASSLSLLAMTACFFLSSSAAFACPGCNEAGAYSENPAASAKLTQGWARSITLLMWTPYLLFGGVTLAIVRSTRRKK